MNSAKLATNPVEAAVSAAVERFAPAKVWVAYSGGVDSTALLLAAARLRAEWQADLAALHVNHGLAEASEQWVSHCEAVCAALQIPLTAVAASVDRSGNMEANARAARYGVFNRYVGSRELLLLGHHVQDQTETILYRVFQGRGLSPMRASGRLVHGDFVRPLLGLQKEVLEAYANEHGVSWVEDPSNLDQSYARNFLRHQVVPLLKSHWHGLHEAVQRVARTQAAATDALVHSLASKPDCIDIAELPSQAAARQAWLRAYLTSRGVFLVSDRGLSEFCEQLETAGLAELQCEGAMLRAYDGRVYFERAGAETVAQDMTIALGERLTLPYGELSLVAADEHTAGAFIYRGPLEVRFRVGGERLRVAGKAQSTTLKQLFSEHRVPPWRRDSYPLLYDGAALVCVPDIALAQSDMSLAAPSSAYAIAHFKPRADDPRRNA